MPARTTKQRQSPCSRMGNPWAIKTPDNRFTFPGDTTIDGEAEALKYAQELYDEQLKERAKVPSVART
jgi:hypothetical protein